MFSIDKKDNIILSELSKEELLELFNKINDNPLSFRRELTISNNISFGNEIEINGIPLDKAVLITELFNDVYGLDGDDRYMVHQEETADAEIVTPVLTNKTIHWLNYKRMFDTLRDTGATIGHNTSSHLHFGGNLINTPGKLSLLLKTLVVFEPIIYKFGYGYSSLPREFLTARDSHCIFSPMMTPKRVKDFTDSLDHYNYKNQGAMKKSFLDFLATDLRFRPVYNFRDFDFSKLHYGIPMDSPSTSDHFEVRCFNGTLRPEISQNNINVIAHIIQAVVEGKIDEDYINSEYARYRKKKYNFDEFCAILYEDVKIGQYNRLLDGFNKIKLEKALKLADMIFDNELDKCYFLKQYLKLYGASEEYVASLVK